MNQGLALKVVKKSTIVDVAREAGVSIGTVSLALNGSDLCSPITAARVRVVAAKLQYVPNHSASSLRRQTTDSIALVVPDIGNPVYVAMAKSVQRVAKERGYHLSLISTDGSSLEEAHAVNGLARRHVDGLIMCSLRASPELGAALEAATASVCVIGRGAGITKVDNVQVDSELGASQAVKHLLETGRRAIAFVNGDTGTAPATARLRGFERGMREAGLEINPLWIFQVEFNIAGGYAVVDGLLKRCPEVDAIFCANDVIAIGVLKRLREVEIVVPKQVAVVGMDDIDECLICTPTLTSVSLAAGDRGRIAAELLLKRLSSGTSKLEPQTITIKPRLIVRESSMDSLTTANQHPKAKHLAQASKVKRP